MLPYNLCITYRHHPMHPSGLSYNLLVTYRHRPMHPTRQLGIIWGNTLTGHKGSRMLHDFYTRSGSLKSSSPRPGGARADLPRRVRRGAAPGCAAPARQLPREHTNEPPCIALFFLRNGVGVLCLQRNHAPHMFP